MKNKTILLTGATGFLGSHILNKILDLKYNVVILKRSFSNLSRIENNMDCIKSYDLDRCSLEGVFQENNINIVLHTATQYGRKDECIVNIVESNLMLPLNLISLAKESGVEIFINTDTLLDKRVNSYSLSKKQFKDWLHFYSNSMVCVNVSLEHFFGANDDQTKFVTFVIKSLINEVESLDLTLGDQERDFIHIDDVVNAFVKILENDYTDNGFYEYELGSGTNIKIKYFILQVSELLNNTTTKLNFGAIPYRENEVMKSHVDLSEILKLGWRANICLEDGLRKTIEEEKRIV